jgi:nitrate/TMAO reductase-like tetraheme cytochrome c subunit
VKRILASLGRGLRRAGRFAWWGLLLLPFLAVPVSYGVEYSNTPQFCNSCHIMEPFYEAWKSGSHSSVACVKCHYPPDVKGKLWTKFQGLAQLVSYVTATESSRPSAHVHDGSCTQCHERETLPTGRAWGTIRFDHAPHLDATRPGRELKCTSCHSQTTRDQHMSIDRGACFLCHLKDQPAGEALGGCTGCHVLPSATVANEGLPFHHAGVVERGIRCDSCHARVTAGDGAVARNRCLQCHASPADLAVLDEALRDPEAKDRLHHAHVKIAAVDCRSCHDEIAHGKDVVRPSHAAAGGDCAACHAAGHRTEAAFGAGQGARGVEGARPDFMFHLGMSCEACHRGAHEGKQDLATACFACHGKGVRGMLEGWKHGIEDWTATTTADLEKVRSALGAEAPEAVKKRLDDVQADVALVGRARGAHNILYAEEIFRSARRTLEDVVKQSGKSVELGALRLPKGEKDCASCHVGAETITGVHEGYPFPHAPHVGKANLACDDCHAAGPPHGRLDLPVSRCADCHHSDDDEDCAKCHEGPARFFAGAGAPGVAAKPDPMAAQVPCAACHADRSAKDQVAAVRKTCVDCHEARYGTMLDEWLKEGAALAESLAGQAASARVALLDGDRSAKGWDEARAIVADADAFLESLEKGRFSHNPGLARTTAEDLKARLARVSSLVEPR